VLEAPPPAGARYAAMWLLRTAAGGRRPFHEWLETHIRCARGHVMSLIRQMRAGRTRSTFGIRMACAASVTRLPI